MSQKLSQDDRIFIAAYSVGLIENYGRILENFHGLYKASQETPSFDRLQAFQDAARQAEAGRFLATALETRSDTREDFVRVLNALLKTSAQQGNAPAAYVFADVLSQLDRV